jgi:uncharacterized LabA/DUF88 family protein
MLGTQGGIRTVYVNKPTQYIFIDGASFTYTLKALTSKIFPGQELYDVIDYTNVSSPYDRTFYYDSIPAQTASQTEEEYNKVTRTKEEFFRHLNRVPNFHVHMATSKRRRSKGTQEQKGDDILIAIEVFQHAVSGNMDVAVIITSDLDFYPLFDALVQTRVKTSLLYDPEKTPPELLDVADVSTPITTSLFVGWLKTDLNRALRLPTGHGTDMPRGDKISVKNVGRYKNKRLIILEDDEHKILHGYSETGRKTISCTNEQVIIGLFNEGVDKVEF